MKVFALWWGGDSYSLGTVGDNTEEFPSMRAAMAAFAERYFSNGLRDCRIQYVGLPEEWTKFPSVGRNCEMMLYLVDPRGSDDPCPDWRVFFGRDGGVRRERC